MKRALRNSGKKAILNRTNAPKLEVDNPMINENKIEYDKQKSTKGFSKSILNNRKNLNLNKINIVSIR